MQSPRAQLIATVSASAVYLIASHSLGASLTKVQDIGSLPTACSMYVYVPDKLATSPGIMVALHSCQNTASGYFGQMNFSALADTYGFIIIYPESPTANTDRCWDVNSTASLTHDGGDDSQSVVAMVKYALKKYNADPTKVFSVGGSSGAMLTNVLLATYPDVFAAGSAFAGVPYYCFVGSTYWNNECSDGKTTKTGKEWGDLVRKAYPGYSGPRPRMQLWHGVDDTTLNYHNFGEEIKQWTNVLSVSETPTSTEKDKPQSAWTRTLYVDSCGTVQVEANSAANQTHSLQTKGWAEPEVIRFFGLDASNPVKSCNTGGDSNAGGTSSTGGGANTGVGGVSNSGGVTGTVRSSLGGSVNTGGSIAGASKGGTSNGGTSNGGTSNGGTSNGGTSNGGSSNRVSFSSGGLVAMGGSSPGVGGKVNAGGQLGSGGKSIGNDTGTTGGIIDRTTATSGSSRATGGTSESSASSSIGGSSSVQSRTGDGQGGSKANVQSTQGTGGSVITNNAAEGDGCALSPPSSRSHAIFSTILLGLLGIRRRARSSRRSVRTG